jgi:hypothetical protein
VLIEFAAEQRELRKIRYNNSPIEIEMKRRISRSG